MFRRTLIAAAFVTAGISAVQVNVSAEENPSAQFSPLLKPSSSLVRAATLSPASLPQRILVPAVPVALSLPTDAQISNGSQRPALAASPLTPAVTSVSPSKAIAQKAPTKLALSFSASPGATSPTIQLKSSVSEAAKVASPVTASAGPVLATLPRQTPARLASREARARDLMLARLDADLLTAEKRLDRAQVRLSAGQRSLQSVVGALQSAMLEAGPDSRGLHPFVRVAQRYLGTPYVWGGESARGFDCSGFIMRVMRDLGYKALPHSAAEQFRYGTPIARELLQPGDLVFFANTYKPGISHVGIYLGRGRFIHAANSNVGTIISSLNTPKWVEKYAGARRLIKG